MTAATGEEGAELLAHGWAGLVEELPGEGEELGEDLLLAGFEDVAAEGAASAACSVRPRWR
ncbi:MAG: hypothetical protein GEV03_23410 [Streptosporangiales bacterium]|nr:hypothetical protein [Streptosporangiales bacterium]